VAAAVRLPRTPLPPRAAHEAKNVNEFDQVPECAPMRKGRDGGWSRITTMLVVVIVLLAGAGVGGYFYIKHHRDYANITSEQGFMSSADSNIVNFVQWQESADGVLTGTIQTTQSSPFLGSPPRTDSQQLNGHVNGTHIVLTTTATGKTTTFYGTLSEGMLNLTFPASDTSCPGSGDVTELFKLVTVAQFNDAPRHMTGKAPSC
jgi:hypothetical protein